MMKIASPNSWTKGKLIEYDIEDKPCKYDLCAALAISYLELNKQMPRDRIEDRIININKIDDLQQLFDIFVSAYEEVHGTIKNEKGNPVKSQFNQVKIGAINDMSTHLDLYSNLSKLVESLG